LILTLQGEIGAEVTGEMKEQAGPCLQPTTKQKLSTTVQLNQTNGQHNAESKTYTDVEYPM